MFFLRYLAVPARDHPEHGVLGEAFVCCWVVRKTLVGAERAARRNLRAERWHVLGRDAAHAVSAADYPAGDEWRAFHDQALTDGEVYLFHTSPRFPVYLVVAAVERRTPRQAAEAHYFISGESLVGEGRNVAVPNFWSKARRQRARKAARDAIAEAGWNVLRVVSEQPCGQTDLPEDFRRYYDEAEEAGACLVFVHDARAEGRSSRRGSRRAPKSSRGA